MDLYGVTTKPIGIEGFRAQELTEDESAAYGAEMEEIRKLDDAKERRSDRISRSSGST